MADEPEVQTRSASKTIFTAPESTLGATTKVCLFRDCGKPHFKEALCVDHYRQKLQLQKEQAAAEEKKREKAEESGSMPGVEIDPELDAKTGRIRVKVTGTEEIDKILWYHVEAYRPGQAPCKTKYRFNQFDAVRDNIENFYRKNYPHLASNVPQLPTKKPNIPFISPHNAEFLEDRRRGIDQYLDRLVQLPHANENPLIFEFLGLGMPENGTRYELPKGERLAEIQVIKEELKEEEGKGKIVYYTVNCRLLPSKQVSTVVYRYKDIQEFSVKISQAVRAEDSEVAKTLPEFPVKRFKLYEDHTTAEFRKQRRALLHKYLTDLIKIDLAAQDPHFWKFAGFVDFAYKKNKFKERLRKLGESNTIMPNLG